MRFAIAADPPARLDKAVSRDVPEAAALSRTRLARLIADGAVRVNGAVEANPKAKVAEGDAIESISASNASSASTSSDATIMPAGVN